MGWVCKVVESFVSCGSFMSRKGENINQDLKLSLVAVHVTQTFQDLSRLEIRPFAILMLAELI